MNQGQEVAFARPRAVAIGSWWGVVGVLVLLVAAVVGWHDALVAWGALHGPGWLVRGGTSVGVVTPTRSVLVAGIVLAVLGLVLLVAAVRVPRATLFQVRGAPTVYLRPEDLARLASTVAAGVPGVLGATTSVRRRSARVSVRTTGGSDVRDDVQAAVAALVAGVDPAPTVSVGVREVPAPAPGSPA